MTRIHATFLLALLAVEEYWIKKPFFIEKIENCKI